MRTPNGSGVRPALYEALVRSGEDVLNEPIPIQLLQCLPSEVSREPSRPAAEGTLQPPRVRLSLSLFSFVPPVPAEAFVDFLAGGQGRIQPRVERRSPGAPAAWRPIGALRLRTGINHDSLYLIELSRSRIAGRWKPATNADMPPPPSLGKYSRSLRKRTSSPAPGLPWGNATTPHLRLDGSRRDPDR
jgi:hypothetical protein